MENKKQGTQNIKKFMLSVGRPCFSLSKFNQLDRHYFIDLTRSLDCPYFYIVYVFFSIPYKSK